MRVSPRQAHAGKPRLNLTAVLIVYAFLLALGLGLGSAYAVLKEDPPFGVLRLGPWQTWLKLGSTDADPYMRAIVARRGDIPLATGEGVALIARFDNQGRRFDTSCSYRVGSVTPPARLWTMTIYDRANNLAVTDLGRRGFTSGEIIRNADNKFVITLSRDLQPGNWIQLPAAGSFNIVLRLYDTPGAAGSNLDAGSLPTIERVGCPS
ncbi:DUF1214 domain-containing protein [Microvirga terricola]|uniref:DUF1214 domain-containing protein n=1 Tax=Microvirga terricola TaxID=2719797 RepID=A0ABX0VEV9_9HYPH|nr:DUF1214 domain-containing protein [Microvirga terricola]NIX76876.1 DUF1214 domain-containing protein [Microvirga terricola]